MSTAPHLQCNLPKPQRSLISQLRLGILPIGIETGRFPSTPECERICQLCTQNKVESESHFMFECDLYIPYREELETSIGLNLDNLNVKHKFCLVFNHPYALGRYIEKSFRKRREMLYK